MIIMNWISLWGAWAYYILFRHSSLENNDEMFQNHVITGVVTMLLTYDNMKYFTNIYIQFYGFKKYTHVN